ncbi:MAG: pilus assembly protein [Acidobacteriia bacterium]|nr:pilus assembly protein [Terriglobia bacterium]
MKKSILRRGNSLVEFTLVGIPLLFVLISIFEVARGMWVYHTLAYAMKEATRFVIVKGSNCIATGNSCGVTVAQVATAIQDRGVGLLPGELNVTLSTVGGTVTCSPLSVCAISTQTCAPLTSCTSSTTPWPTLGIPADPGSYRGNDIVITGTYPFKSAISLFWPGSGPQSFGVFLLGASSRETIQF